MPWRRGMGLDIREAGEVRSGDPAEGHIAVDVQLRRAPCLFFFQADGGIRDWSVTGVQTCALPILARQVLEQGADVMTSGNHIWDRKEIVEYITKENLLLRPANYPAGTPGVGHVTIKAGPHRVRSEERRVGKECRARWPSDD